MKCMAIVPVSHNDPEYKNNTILKLNKKNIIDYTLNNLQNSSILDKIVVATDSNLIIDYINNNYKNIDVFVRESGRRSESLVELYQEILHYFKNVENYNPKYIVQTWCNYPFRRKNLINDVLNELIKNNLNSIFCVYPEFNTYWHYVGDSLHKITTDSTQIRLNRSPIYRDLKGLCSISSSENILNNNFICKNTGMYVVKDFCSTINIHDLQGYYIAPKIAEYFDENNTELTEIYENNEHHNNTIHHSIERKVLAAKGNLKKGYKIKKSDITNGKYDYGISIDKIDSIIGCKLLYNVKKGQAFTYGIIEC